MDERERLLGILEELEDKDLETFAFFLPDAIPRGKRNTDSRVDLAKVILQYYPENTLYVVVEVLNKIPRKDLASQLKDELRRGGPRYDRTEEQREVAAAGKSSQAAAHRASRLRSVETESCCPGTVCRIIKDNRTRSNNHLSPITHALK